MPRPDVDEVNVETVDVRLELREGVQLRLSFSPVVVCSPVANEFPELCQLRPLRLIWNRFAVGPARSLKSLAKITNGLVWHVRTEGPNRTVFCRGQYDGFGPALRWSCGLAGGNRRF